MGNNANDINILPILIQMLLNGVEENHLDEYICKWILDEKSKKAFFTSLPDKLLTLCSQIKRKELENKVKLQHTIKNVSKKLYKVKEAAKLLNLSEPKLREMIADGTINTVNPSKSPRGTKICSSEIERLMQ
ncbi:helix-turn-helix domain-containing protein [Vicingus serpentipes]|uniref:Helix-turn-helix domain-containing protein n=1 Tax=Vicingus serpentipes TaxID=1926625 RepID=A0A5C6RYX2_9FLAO|nr:helix-turn-helix domain-containing protein [Vicingus serpentipes]TXB67257.1 helix-turn-helix domain-containing protein [Vicingus serpentipes]